MEAGAVAGEGVALRLRPCSSCSVEVVEGREGKERGASSREERGEEEPSTRLSSLNPVLASSIQEGLYKMEDWSFSHFLFLFSKFACIKSADT
jgi:hypothetical protein